MHKETLKNTIARGVLRAPSIRPDTGEFFCNEIAATVRPPWSKQEPGAIALAGGKLEVADFHTLLELGLITEEQLEDPDFVPSQELRMRAAKVAVAREMNEELDFVLPADMDWKGLKPIVNGKYETIPFYADLSVKPDLAAKAESGGTLWIPETTIVAGQIKMLAGNLEVSQAAIMAMNLGL